MSKHPSYKSYLPDIQKYLREKGMSLTYSFVHLCNRSLHPPWAFSKKTLRTARDSGGLICDTRTSATGEWVWFWAHKTPEERRVFAQSKLAKQLRKNAA